MQIHNRYLVTESAEGVLVIDQHALHERILYEQLRAKVLAGGLETQNLLVPEPVDLSAGRGGRRRSSSASCWRSWAFAVEPFGGGTVLVSSYPAMLARRQPAELLRDMVELLVAGSRSSGAARSAGRTVAHDVLQGRGQGGGPARRRKKSTALLAQRHLAQDTHHCPHGRPTALVFTREDLDRQFMRT